MAYLWFVVLLSLVALVSGDTCEDVDPDSCKALAATNDVCNDPMLSTQVCPKYCNNCPLLCYSGPLTWDSVTNKPVQLPNTITCNAGEVCMLVQTGQSGGQYQAKCGAKQDCPTATKCCRDDLCNEPDPVTTQVPPPTSPPIPDIGFSAAIANNLTLEHSEVVIFDSVILNEGAAYDNTTGKFTCPVSGIYVIQAHTLARLDKHAWLQLYHNDKYIVSIYEHKMYDYGTAGNTVILQLAKGDQVYLKAVDKTVPHGVETSIYGRGDEVFSTFSGYLISPTTQQPTIIG